MKCINSKGVSNKTPELTESNEISAVGDANPVKHNNMILSVMLCLRQH